MTRSMTTVTSITFMTSYQHWLCSACSAAANASWRRYTGPCHDEVLSDSRRYGCGAWTHLIWSLTTALSAGGHLSIINHRSWRIVKYVAGANWTRTSSEKQYSTLICAASISTRRYGMTILSSTTTSFCRLQKKVTIHRRKQALRMDWKCRIMRRASRRLTTVSQSCQLIDLHGLK